MLLLKTTLETLDQVIKNCKHASHNRPKEVLKGDIILIAQTKRTLINHKKSIRFIMHLDDCYEDKSNESDKIWGRHWKYIIKGYNLQSIKPFDIEEIQVSTKNYGPIVTHCSLLKEDEDAVLAWIKG